MNVVNLEIYASGALILLRNHTENTFQTSLIVIEAALIAPLVDWNHHVINMLIIRVTVHLR